MGERKLRIGLVLDYIASEYSENLLQGVVSLCTEKNIDLLLFTVGEIHNHNIQDYNYQYVATTAQIKKANVDGIIIASGAQMHETSKADFMSYLRSYKSLPIVNISMKFSGIPSIIVDCNDAFDSLIQYLITEQDCKKFALMGVESNSFDVKSRTDIFKKVLKRNSISLKSTVFWKSNFEYERAYRILYDYYKKKQKFDFDAIVALNDNMAFACMDFCTRFLGLKIPEDIIITGFDDLTRSSFSVPSLTSVNQKLETQGYLAAKTLVDILENIKVPMLQVVKAKTFIRQSSNKIQKQNKSLEDTDFIQYHEQKYNDKNSVFEWYTKRTQLLQAANFYSGMHHEVEINRVGKKLTEELKRYGFQSLAIVIYEKPIEQLLPFEYFNLPNKVKLIGGFDYKTHFNLYNGDVEIIFNPYDNMVPENILEYSSEGHLVAALYHNSIQYGYIILNRGDYDLGVYDLVSKAVANQIASSFAYTKIIQERSMIKDQYIKMDIIAHTDELTGLKNRRGFFESGESAMKLAEAEKQSGLIIYCDMDGLKKINDTYGHEAGDIAIKTQAEILKKNFRVNDIVARLSGDEFVIISPSLTPKVFDTIKNQIKEDCKSWSAKNESKFSISLSLGYVEYPVDKIGYSLTTLLADADSSLYVEKRRKKALKLQEQKKEKIK